MQDSSLDKGLSQEEDTHQIDPVDIHPAQGPPAQISVIVFGVCIHTARVISRDTAEEGNGKLGLIVGRERLWGCSSHFPQPTT